MKIDLHEASLANICDGHLEREFQNRLAEIRRDVLSHIDEYESSKGMISTKITLEVVLGIDTETMSMVVGGRSSLKKPGRRLVTRGLHQRDGKFCVADEWKQTPLFGKTRAEPADGGDDNSAPEGE